jgi:hypothetical protein
MNVALRVPPDVRAKEIVESFSNIITSDDYEHEALQCAISAVKIVLASHKKDYEDKEATTYWHPYDYWLQVYECLKKQKQ